MDIRGQLSLPRSWEFLGSVLSEVCLDNYFFWRYSTITADRDLDTALKWATTVSFKIVFN